MAESSLAEKQIVLIETTSSKRVRIITLNRPNALNAMTASMAETVFDRIRQADSDENIRAIVVTGKGRAFCAGVDVKELSTLTPETAMKRAFVADWNTIMNSLQTPVIAAVNGFALGGGFELALMCDIIHCATDTQFSFPEINLGTIPGIGGTQRLITAIGKSHAMQMILSAQRLNAQDALRLGLVSEIHSPESLLDRAVALAETIAQKSGVTIALARKAVNYAHRDISHGLDLERQLYYSSFGTKAFQEGCSAFIAKRKANFDDC